ncbi:MAG: prolipoprotein diacylglyceryl transferase [Chloroflexota bacterium]|jgi:phosphatidylglycerol:prolipoprotein diacylglycerol transferase|nr:prolipoprotein diacylglyceryl transferase [Chloroflexota bacterium]
MYPTLPFGPASLPTAPILAILAVLVTLEIASRYGRKLGLHPDDVWNTALIGLAAGLIVARVWNVFQFWHIYRVEPSLIFSLRPSGFEFWPGVIAAFIGGYAYLLYRALDPVRIGASLAVGMLGGAAVQAVSGHLTGGILGLVSTAPWAQPYFGEFRHPAGLYLALGLALLAVAIWLRGPSQHPDRVFLLAVLGYSLMRLFVDGFRDGMDLIGSMRAAQVIALIVALACAALLARRPKDAGERS